MNKLVGNALLSVSIFSQWDQPYAVQEKQGKRDIVWQGKEKSVS